MNLREIMRKAMRNALSLIVMAAMMFLLGSGALLADTGPVGPDLFRLGMPEVRARALAEGCGGADDMLFPWAGAEWRGRLRFEQGRLTTLSMTAQQSVPLAGLLNHLAGQGYAPLYVESGDAGAAGTPFWLYEPAFQGRGPRERVQLVLDAHPVRVLLVSRDLLAVFTHAARTGGDLQGVRGGNLRARVFEWRVGPPETLVLTSLEQAL